MKPSAVILCLFVVLLLAGLVWSAVHWQRKLAAATPEKLPPYATEDAALQAAFADARGRMVYSVAGHSMAPYIPERGPGEVEAYAVTVPDATFDQVQSGDLCLHRDPNSPVGITMHQASARLGDEWVMSGQNNTRYDDFRMTRATFIGIVAKTYVWEDHP